jgi:hypothetical protein
MHITRLASNVTFSPSNKIHREVGRAKDISAPLYRLGYHDTASLPFLNIVKVKDIPSQTWTGP